MISKDMTFLQILVIFSINNRAPNNSVTNKSL